MEAKARLRKAFARSRLFRQIDPDPIASLRVEPATLAEGELLFREGETAHHAFVVESGILGLYAGRGEGPISFFRKAVPGDLVGEYGLLCSQPRSASAVALTAVDVLRLDKAGLEALWQHNPTLQSRLVASLAEAASIGRDPRNAPLNTILVHDIHPGSPLTGNVLARLPGSLARSGAALPITPIEPGGLGEETLHQRLIEATQSDGVGVFLTAGDAVLSDRNLKLIERLVLLGDGTAATPRLPAGVCRGAILARLWPGGVERVDSRRWTPDPALAQVLNLRDGDERHLERLGRAVLRRQNVLVLGGGGARGFAHIGAIQAMQELGIDDIDLVMGVSFGSLVASLAAFELPAAEILAQLERVIIRSKPYSLTLPRASLFVLDNSRRELGRFFGSAGIQDSWLGLQCFSTNLSRNCLHTWSSGTIPDAVIASMSVPGIFPPVVDGRGDLHVDGGILCNLPVAAARQLTDGRITAISLDVPPEAAEAATPTTAVRPPTLGRTIVNAMMCASHAASQAQERFADVLLRPPIGAYPLLEWKSYREIHAAGYHHALDILAPLRMPATAGS